MRYFQLWLTPVFKQTNYLIYNIIGSHFIVSQEIIYMTCMDKILRIGANCSYLLLHPFQSKIFSYQ